MRSMGQLVPVPESPFIPGQARRLLDAGIHVDSRGAIENGAPRASPQLSAKEGKKPGDKGSQHSTPNVQPVKKFFAF
jgi:hypothetical protein